MALEGLNDDEIEELETELLGTVTDWGGVGGNISLIRELEWPDDQYWAIRDRLVDAGSLVLGRGKGGSVRIAETEEEDDEEQEEDTAPRRQTEGSLYEPLASLIKERWVRDQRFERSIVEISAWQGRRETGGTWTRPDLVVLSYTTLLYVPGKHFEVVTFEVKPWDSLSVTGVYEALAHRRASSRSYLIACVPEAVLEETGTEDYLQQIAIEAKRHGVGFVVVSDVNDYEGWDERVEAVRHDPAPHALNDFISLQLSDGGKEQLLTWFR